MRLLFLGDIVGRPGREAVFKHLPMLKDRLDPDFIVINGENAAAGFGITRKICDEIFDAGADVITTGNHVWDQKEALGFIDDEPRLLRPLNYPPGTPGKGVGLFEGRNGHQVLVINAIGQLFMNMTSEPWAPVEEELANAPLKQVADAIIVDFHAEATSEKMSMGHFVDGKASFCVGTHTHVPTADTMILPGGTAYQTDAGACAVYDSVIGMDKAEPVQRFISKVNQARLFPAEGEATVCGTHVEVSSETGLASRVEPVRVGGLLTPHIPEV